MKWNNILPIIIAAIAFTSCTEWEEPQLDDDFVEVLTPRDSLRTDVVSQLFFWYEVADAVDYELQIVSPSFSTINRFVLDTIVTTNKVQFTLTPGTYQWSVRALNNSSATDYTTHTLFVDSTIDLTTQTIVLLNPSNQDTTPELNKTFSWQSLYNAENYRFELWQPDESGQQVLLRSTTIDSVEYLATAEGAYLWKVRGENFLTNTIFSERTFYIDTTSPNTPALQEPDSGSVVDDTNIDFRWTRGTNTGSSLTDTMFLATDANMQNISQVIISNSNIVVIDTLSDGLYYWRVRSSDAAGNVSDYSQTHSFTRQQ